MAEQDDLNIIAALIDANCRAHNEEFGFHLDSRCLKHYNDGIARLAEAGMITLMPIAKGAEPLGLGEKVWDQQEPRLRATYVPQALRTDRPTTDPMWALFQKETLRLRQEMALMRERQGLQPEPEPTWMAGPDAQGS